MSIIFHDYVSRFSLNKKKLIAARLKCKKNYLNETARITVDSLNFWMDEKRGENEQQQHKKNAGDFFSFANAACGATS